MTRSKTGRLFLGSVFVLALAGISSPADADVLCANPSGSVFVRTQCKGNEATLDPTALGLVGPPGLSGLIVVWDSLISAGLNPTILTVSCPDGKIAVGGGGGITSFSGAFLQFSGPVGPDISGTSGTSTTPTGWQLKTFNVNPGVEITGYAICAEPAP